MHIDYPYKPSSHKYQYVNDENEFMQVAKKIAMQSGCAKQSTGAVIVRDSQIIGQGCNAGKKVDICPREIKKSKTGEDYYLCKEVCQQDGHAEVSAIKDALKKTQEISNTDIYLYGHWWCCKNCWDHMISAGIKNVYLLDNSWEIFKK